MVTLIQRLCSQSGTRTCPESYQDFLSELSRNSPACGLFQLGDNREVIHSLTTVIQWSVNVQDTSSHCELSAHQSMLKQLQSLCASVPKIKMASYQVTCAPLWNTSCTQYNNHTRIRSLHQAITLPSLVTTTTGASFPTYI